MIDVSLYPAILNSDPLFVLLNYNSDDMRQLASYCTLKIDIDLKLKPLKCKVRATLHSHDTLKNAYYSLNK